jgi:activator of HSP90 ATPase
MVGSYPLKSLKIKNNMLTGTIEQVIEFEATPEEVYDLIMNSEKHSDFTGSEVTMSQAINGKFSVFDGYCTGYNMELIKGKMIKQAWHFKEEGWPDNHFSVCTFIFNKSNKGCLLNFSQTDIPENRIKALSEGWEEYYWDAIKAYLESLK